ncbi:MAG: SDR family NAD(P)-dependent oxidoreductase [Candidatus Zixiibacteriota bacterium]|nr:MAG: SDR family NAD(P)-dependent oxidoreductase [candidate division Zixibacteria bacterium]
MKIKGRKALITGASKGIGRAVAKSLASEGVDLFLTARDGNLLENLIKELSASDVKAGYKIADLAFENEVNELFADAVKFLGDINILINNAGIGIRGNVTEIEVSDWEKMYSVNLKAAFMLSRLAAREMIKRQSGYIINIGSGASQTPIAEYAGYCASKYGLLGFSESLGLELRERNIKVSIILPGSTATHFGGAAPEDKISAKPGILRPDDVANSVLYLLKQSDIAWTSVMNLRPLNLKRAHHK